VEREDTKVAQGFGVGLGWWDTRKEIGFYKEEREKLNRRKNETSCGFMWRKKRERRLVAGMG